VDGHIWWIKPVNNPQGPRVPINELVVARLGALIEAPLCEVGLIEIPDELAGVKYREDRSLEAGLASGSMNLDGVVEVKGSLADRDKADNARRHAGIFAVYDWCWGSDEQYLYEQEEKRRTTYSHDHGHYFPGGPNWTADTLAAHVDNAHALPDPAGLDPRAVRDYAKRLREVARSDIVDVLRGVPPEWAVTTPELETLGWFLERRTETVAARLDGIAETLTGGSAS
jgi:hypothetical protein